MEHDTQREGYNVELEEIRLKKTLDKLLDVVEDSASELGTATTGFQVLLNLNGLGKSDLIEELTQKLSDLENDLLDFVDDIQAEIDLR